MLGIQTLDVRFSRRPHSGIQMDFVRSDTLNGLFDLGDLLGAGIDRLDEKNFEPYLPGKFITKLAQPGNHVFNANTPVWTINGLESLIVTRIQ